LGVLLGLLGRALPASDIWNLLGGLALLAAIALGISLLPFWGRVLPTLQPFPGLFRAPRASERWCDRCGSPTPRKGACRTCGHAPARATGRTPPSRGK
jgi:hypothetical protein